MASKKGKKRGMTVASDNVNGETVAAEFESTGETVPPADPDDDIFNPEEVDATPFIEEWKDAEKALIAAKRDYDYAEQAVSDSLCIMAEKIGSGPFMLGGRTVTITSRTYADRKGADGKPLVRYFFKRIGAAVRDLG
jgi:hypothetical protein